MARNRSVNIIRHFCPQLGCRTRTPERLLLQPHHRLQPAPRVADIIAFEVRLQTVVLVWPVKNSPVPNLVGETTGLAVGGSRQEYPDILWITETAAEHRQGHAHARQGAYDQGFGGLCAFLAARPTNAGPR